MSILQLIIIGIVIFASMPVIFRFYYRSIGYGMFLFWSAIWLAVLLFAFKPGLADKTAAIFGIQRGSDIAFFFSTILLFYLVFRLYIMILHLDKEITKLAINVSKSLHKEKRG